MAEDARCAGLCDVQGYVEVFRSWICNTGGVDGSIVLGDLLAVIGQTYGEMTLETW